VPGHLTDVPGVRVGHWTDTDSGTGCTVIVPPAGTTGACDARGGGVSARETELFAPGRPDREVTALVFSGGSAFGLATADGVMRWCAEQGLGLETPAGRVPIVPAAVIFDLGIATHRPGPNDGYAAARDATTKSHDEGSVGAGTGATVGKWNGQRGWCKGGLGTASATTPDGASVAALAVVNAFGDVLDETGDVLAGVYEPGIGFLRAAHAARRREPEHPRLSGPQNTTLICVATDARLGAAELSQVARMANSGAAHAISPASTALDGDIAFAMATHSRAANPFVIGVLAAEVSAEAIRRGVRSATAVRGVPTGAERCATN
jgi:L-aminopeptidase/D-esterase-like protein